LLVFFRAPRGSWHCQLAWQVHDSKKLHAIRSTLIMNELHFVAFFKLLLSSLSLSFQMLYCHSNSSLKCAAFFVVFFVIVVVVV